MQMKALVIIPTYNERENLPRLIPQILSQGSEFQVLVVDDNSPDGTGGVADELVAADPRVHVMHRDGKRGLGTAYVAGFKWALAEGFDYVFEMDADFSHDPAYLAALITATENADLAIGSRYVPGGGVTDWGPVRRFISRGGSAYARLALRVPVRDLTGGFKCFRREVLEAIDLDSIEARGYAFQVETTYRALKMGFRVVELPILFRDRREGSSKMNKSIVAEAIWRVPAMRFRRW
jgi:dolichol-phosphate mannosyltransferase